MSYKISYTGDNVPYGGDCFKRYKDARAHLKSLGFVPDRPGLIYPHKFLSKYTFTEAIIHSIK